MTVPQLPSGQELRATRSLPLDVTSAIQLTTLVPRVISDIGYRTIAGTDVKLDVYQPVGLLARRPTLMFFHGGGWLGAYTKGCFPFLFTPFLHLGWKVINVDYRPSEVSLAPAAVDDCLHAMRWLIQNARTYDVDTRNIVLMGNSAGGHLALTTGLIPAALSSLEQFSALVGGDAAQDPVSSVRPAAIINWYGVSDVADLIEGPNRQEYAVAWLGSQVDRVSIARSVSPLTYVRPGVPPVITIHGDRDLCVPYSHAVRLHEALGKAAVPNKLVTIKGGEHGDFDFGTNLDIYCRIFEFLQRVGVQTGGVMCET